MTATGENTRVKLDYIDSVIFIIHDNNKYDIILGGNSRHIQDRVSGLFTIRQWFLTNFFASYPYNALCRLNITMRYKYSVQYTYIPTIYFFTRVGEVVNFFFRFVCERVFDWPKYIV